MATCCALIHSILVLLKKLRAGDGLDSGLDIPPTRLYLPFRAMSFGWYINFFKLYFRPDFPPIISKIAAPLAEYWLLRLFDGDPSTGPGKETEISSSRAFVQGMCQL